MEENSSTQLGSLNDTRNNDKNIVSSNHADNLRDTFVIEREDGEVQLMLDPNDDKEKSANINRSLKMAKDGRTILVPQPSDDPHDPLNWSNWKKYMILITIALGGFNVDFASGVGIPAIPLQAEEWSVSPTTVIGTQNLNVLMLGVGNVFWIPFIHFWGRAPVFFWSSIIGTLFSLGCALSGSLPAFYGLRALQGFFLALGQSLGLAVIKDMFFYHEHARAIGIYICIFLLSPYIGPQFAGWMITGLGSWRPPFWLAFAFGIIVIIMTIIFMEETYYDRRNPPRRDDNLFKRRLYDITGLSIRSESRDPIRPSFMRLFNVLTKPVILPMMIFLGLTFMWSVGINVTSSTLVASPPPVGYGYSLNATSFIYFSPILALIIGELIGHWLNDFVAYWYVKRHHGTFVPEARLWPNWLALALMVPGLAIVGQTLQFHWNVAGIILPWGIYLVGVMISTVCTSAYVLDCYPNAAGEVMALLNLARTLLGFSVGYYQQSWGAQAGFNVSFGIQAGIVAAAFIIILALQFYGKPLRHWGGPVNF